MQDSEAQRIVLYCFVQIKIIDTHLLHDDKEAADEVYAETVGWLMQQDMKGCTMSEKWFSKHWSVYFCYFLICLFCGLLFLYSFQQGYYYGLVQCKVIP